ncbi:MAG: DUF2971 domain-containing protein [Bacteroidales bacterium]|nr:DUF2971 domain-containing protein [Bacteroidales bacterium]
MVTKIDFDNNDQVLNYVVNNGELPRYIYKYTSLESLHLILESSKLKFSKPSEFNDPFDCHITIDTDNTESEIDNYIKFLEKNNDLTEEKIKILKKKFHNPKELFEITNKSVNGAIEKHGVTCFSKKEDNLIMWAHYADKHKGVCLKFDILGDTDFFMTPFPVIYKKEYSRYNYIRNKDGLGKFLLETKSIDWEYEQEIRVMKLGAGLYDFKNNSLVEIIFGSRTLKEEREQIVKMTKENLFKITKFKHCMISDKEFAIEICDYLQK